MNYYLINCRSFYRNHFSIWCSNDKDSIYVVDGMLAYFETESKARLFADKRKIQLCEEAVSLVDFDRILVWLSKPSQDIDFPIFLDAWNMFGDIAASYANESDRFEGLTEKHIGTYRKLFYGSNIKALRGSGAKFQPQWRSSDFEGLREIFNYGFSLFRKYFREQIV